MGSAPLFGQVRNAATRPRIEVPVVDVAGDGGVVDREGLEGHLHAVVRHGLPHELQLTTITP